MQTTNALVIDRVTLLAEFGRYPANSVKWLVHVDVHDFVLDVLILALLFRAVLRLVVITRTRHVKQLQLPADAQIAVMRIYLGFSMSSPNAKVTAAVVKRIAEKQKKEGAKHEKRNSAHRAN